MKAEFTRGEEKAIREHASRILKHSGTLPHGDWLRVQNSVRQIQLALNKAERRAGRRQAQSERQV